MSLNPKQFYRERIGTPGTGRHYATRYNLVGDHPDFPPGVAQATYASARVHHQANAERFAYRDEPRPKYPSQAEIDARLDLHAGDRPGAQGRLFGYGRQPNQSVVEGLYIHPSQRARVPTMLGLVAQDVARDFGPNQPVVPSNNLSEHSDRIVAHLAEQGKIEAPKDVVRNDLDFFDDPEPWVPGAAAWEVPAEEVESARQFGRETIVGRRRRRQPEQMRLFE